MDTDQTAPGLIDLGPHKLSVCRNLSFRLACSRRVLQANFLYALFSKQSQEVSLKNKLGAVGGTDAPAITLIPIAQMVLKYLSANSILLMNGEKRKSKLCILIA